MKSWPLSFYHISASVLKFRSQLDLGCQLWNNAHACNWCDRKSRAAYVQSFAQWQQATIEIMLAISLTIACSRYRYDGVILHAHPVRDESHNQCNTTGEVATSPPFYNEPHRSHVLCVKAELCTTFTSWSQHHFVAIGNPERHMRKASHRGSKQQ